ncbi:MAG: hypothetical protein ABI665_20450 [Vicinamibacterales bacterium]
MIKKLALLACSSVIAVAGCTTSADVEKVPVGAEVEIVRADGGVVHGTLTGRDERTVKVDVGKTSRIVPREQIADVRVVDRTKPAPLPPAAKFREFTLPEGTRLNMRLQTAVASDTSRVEDPVEATLTDAVMVDGIEVLPAGSAVHGEVAAVDPAGKVKGRASLALRFTSIAVAGRDERTTIVARREYLAEATKGKDAAKIGIPAAGGAILGGILGGKKGAAIGAGVGGGAGTAVVLSTSGDEVRLASGATLTVSTDQASEVRVPVSKSR